MKYYAVHKGIKPGVYTSWMMASAQVNNFPGATHKLFRNEADATFFVEHGYPREPEQTTKSVLIDNGKSITSMDTLTQTEPHDTHDTHGTHDKKVSTINQLINEYYSKENNNAGTLIIYTDGSTMGNGKSWAYGGYGVFYSDQSLRPINKRITNGKVTNNVCELRAIIAALQTLNKKKYSKIILYTDSELSMLALTKRFYRWEKNGWTTTYKGKTTPIKNKELIIRAHSLSDGIEIKWIKAHTDKQDIHSIGNRIADLLAELPNDNCL